MSDYEKIPSSLPPAYTDSVEESPSQGGPQSGTTPAALSLAQQRSRRRAVLFSFLTILTGAVLLATGAGMGAFNGLCGRSTASGDRARAALEDYVHTRHNAGENFKREFSTIPESHAKYSTSVYENGETSTFVYTTRPIVSGTLSGSRVIPC